MTNEAKYTPGKWKAEIWKYDNQGRKREVPCITNDEYQIASMTCDEGKENPFAIKMEEAIANSVLMASAPELLEALRCVVEAEFGKVNPFIVPKGTYWEKAVNAIIKAEGR